ncbi:MAG: glycosyltransferase family 4 protein [Leadbetterella sp.]|nr:glycosyltransferase family 4 protein [Leadbetterella sp.]
MKILQLISSSGYFGAENVLVQLASELNKNDTCHVISGVIENLVTPHLEVIDESKKRGIQTAHFACRGKFDLINILQLRQFIKTQGINILHSHGYKSNLYSFFSAIGLKVALVATCHNWLGDDIKMRFYSYLDRIFLRQFSQVVAVSSDVQNKIIQSNISSDKVSIIRNGIDLSRFENAYLPPNFKSTLSIPEDHLVIGTVGRISSVKGHQHLLNLVSAIGKEYPKTSFLLVGDGDLLTDLQAKFNKPNIIFTGLRKDLPELYKCMDIFVLPSLTEGLPMVLLEAMASQLPVVATQVGYIPKVIIDNETGFLVEPGDEEGLKKSLLYLLTEPKRRKVMGMKGYLRVKDGFSSAQMAQDYLKIYQKALGMEQ